MLSKHTPLKILMIACALSLVLGACASPTTEAPKPATEAPKAATSPAGTAAPTAVSATATAAPAVDIELWVLPTVSESGPPPENWIAYKIIKEKLNINLKLVLMPTGTDGATKLNAAAAANALPDIFQMVSTTDSRTTLAKLADQGLIAPVDEMLPLMPERTKRHYNDKVLLSLMTVGGKLYGLPEPPPLPKREGLVIRKDWLDKLGLKAPTTADELFDVAKAFTEKDPDGNGKADTYGLGGFINGNGLGDRFDFMLGAYGVPGRWNFDNASLLVRDPNYPKALTYFKKYVDAKVIDPDWQTLKRDDFRARWKQGKFGIMWEDFAALATVSNYSPFDKNFPNAEWVALPAPKGPDGKAYYGVFNPTGQVFAVSKKAADAGKVKAIAKLLEWMAIDEGYYLLGFGQENVNYKIDKDGNITTDGLDPKLAWTDASQQPFTQLRNSLVYYNAANEVKARYPSYKTQNGRTMDPMEFLKYFQGQPWMDGRGTQTIVSPKNIGDFNTYYNQGLVKFAGGQSPLTDASWADFLKGLDGLGAKEWETSAKKDLQAGGFLK